MRYSIYNPEKSMWNNVETTDPAAFLEKYKHGLTNALLHSSVNRLKSYEATQSNQSATLTLGGCRIVVSNTSEAMELLACVETALESNINKN